MAIHCIDYDRSLEGLWALRSGNFDIVGSWFGCRFICRFTSGFLGRRSRLGTGRLGFVLFREIVLQPLGWETHGGLVEEGRREGTGVEGSRMVVLKGSWPCSLYIKGTPSSAQSGLRKRADGDWSVGRCNGPKVEPGSQVGKQEGTRASQRGSSVIGSAKFIR